VCEQVEGYFRYMLLLNTSLNNTKVFIKGLLCAGLCSEILWHFHLVFILSYEVYLYRLQVTGDSNSTQFSLIPRLVLLDYEAKQKSSS
jgi:hypothetical protein